MIEAARRQFQKFINGQRVKRRTQTFINNNKQFERIGDKNLHVVNGHTSVNSFRLSQQDEHLNRQGRISIV